MGRTSGFRCALLALVALSAPVHLLGQAPWPDPAIATFPRDGGTSSRCTSETPTIEGGAALGGITLGTTLAGLREFCGELDYGWVWLEGDPTPALRFLLGEVVVLAEMSDTSMVATVRRMSTSSDAARSPDGVGPGVSVSVVAERWPDAELVLEEGAALVSRSHPGISLVISMGEVWDTRAAFRARDEGDLRRLPARTHVASVLLWGG